jgi:glycosyltransferase involved in cell wall biosynthesis
MEPPAIETPERTSVVMATFGRRDQLRRALAPLLAEPAADEIVVVVDGSTDGSIELLEEIAAQHPKLRPLWIENRGEGGARQVGLEASRGDIVVFLDDDVVAAPGLVEGHVRRQRTQANMVVLGYMPLRLQARQRGRDAALRRYAATYEEHCSLWEAKPERILQHFWAGNFSMRRADALSVGLRSPRLPRDAYHQDYDFGLRCSEAGLHGCFDRDIRATHEMDRDLRGFVRDSIAQGRSHPYLPHTVDDPAGRSLRSRALRAFGGSDVGVTIMTTTLEKLVIVLGAARMFRLQAKMLNPLQTLGQLRGRRSVQTTEGRNSCD